MAMSWVDAAADGGTNADAHVSKDRAAAAAAEAGKGAAGGFFGMVKELASNQARTPTTWGNL